MTGGVQGLGLAIDHLAYRIPSNSEYAAKFAAFLDHHGVDGIGDDGTGESRIPAKALAVALYRQAVLEHPFTSSEKFSEFMSVM